MEKRENPFLHLILNQSPEQPLLFFSEVYIGLLSTFSSCWNFQCARIWIYRYSWFWTWIILTYFCQLENYFFQFGWMVESLSMLQTFTCIPLHECLCYMFVPEPNWDGPVTYFHENFQPKVFTTRMAIIWTQLFRSDNSTYRTINSSYVTSRWWRPTMNVIFL